MLPSRTASWSAFLASVADALTDPETHFFVDTSFLLKAGSLNAAARSVLLSWIAAIGRERFHIPAWVAHETYRHLGKDNGAALTPMARLAAEVGAKLEELRTEARRFVDDQTSVGFQETPGAAPMDRSAFLLGLDSEALRLGRRAKHIRDKAAARLEETADVLAELVNHHVMPTGVYDRLPTIEAEYAARLVGDHPPGQKDRKKELNKYGDLLMWREIVDHCGRELNPKRVVLLTDDNKPDWVFRPPSVIDDRENGRPHRTVKNDGSLGFQIILPQPLLTHELGGGRAGFQLHIINLAMLARITADQPELRDLAHAYSAVVLDENQRDHPEVPPDEGDSNLQPPPPVEEPPERRITDLRDIDRAADAVAALATVIARGELPVPAARATGRAVVEAAEAGLETVELFGLSLLTDAVVHPSLRPALLEGMLLGAYLRDDGQIRPRPLTTLTGALFEAAAQPDARAAIARLHAEIGSEGRKYLLLPGEEGRAALTVSLRRRPGGAGKLEAVMLGDVPLLVDGRRGASTSLAALAGGRTEGAVFEFRRLLADHFAVPENRVETNLALADRVSWDEIQCLIDWGTDIDRLLR